MATWKPFREQVGGIHQVSNHSGVDSAGHFWGPETLVPVCDVSEDKT